MSLGKLSPLKYFNMQYNLTIATTPMQIINAIEAINYFNTKNNILVLIFKPRDDNNLQLEKIAKLYLWNKIIRVNNNLKKSKYIEYIKLINELKNFHYNYIFFGNFTSIYKIIISNIKKEHLYLIDDGSATIHIYKNILIPNKINSLSIKELRFLLIGFKTKIKDKINIFTYFTLPYDERFPVVENKLTYFKEKLNKENFIEEDIIFLGQPLASSNFISQTDYSNYLKSIKKIKDKKIIYIPHRFENINSELKELEDRYFKILPIDIPIELYFIYNSIIPTHIISFCTSATFTLEKIYPSLLCENIIIPKEKFLKKQKEFYLCYDTLQEQTDSTNLNIENL